jgi:aspartyl-tRNA(Asn)/glutamyl-tRNA(Gln) amidotransferase subunit B
VLDSMFSTGRPAEEIVAAEGLTQIDDEEQIVELVAGVLARHADAVRQYRGGKTATLGFLVGQVMKATAGKANPGRVNELLKRALQT